MTHLDIRPSRYRAVSASALAAAAQAAEADVSARYGDPFGDEGPVEPIEFDPPAGLFLVAWLDGAPVACAGWRTVLYSAADGGADGGADEVAEIKRLYAAPAARGHGVAAALLEALVENARASGRRLMVAEASGLQQEAARFYEKQGFRRIPNYGHYKNDPGSMSFARDL